MKQALCNRLYLMSGRARAQVPGCASSRTLTRYLLRTPRA
jgi:hypothetical protein